MDLAGSATSTISKMVAASMFAGPPRPAASPLGSPPSSAPPARDARPGQASSTLSDSSRCELPLGSLLHVTKNDYNFVVATSVVPESKQAPGECRLAEKTRRKLAADEACGRVHLYGSAVVPSLHAAGLLPTPDADSRLKSKGLGSGAVVAIAVAHDRGTFAFHGEVAAGKTELQRLAELYFSYSEKLPPREPSAAVSRRLGAVDAEYLLGQLATSLPSASIAHFHASLTSTALASCHEPALSCAGSSAPSSSSPSIISTAVTERDRLAATFGARLVGRVKAMAPTAADVEVSFEVPPNLTQVGAIISSCLANITHIVPSGEQTDEFARQEAQRAEQHAAELRGRPELDFVSVSVDGELVVVLITTEKYPWHGVRCRWIEQLMVRSDFRKNGVGRACMGFVLDTAKSAGCDVVALDVHKTNCDALDFYGRVGWTSRLASNLTGPGGEWCPTITLFKSITQDGKDLPRLPMVKVGQCWEVPLAEGGDTASQCLRILEDRYPGDPLFVYDFRVPLKQHYTGKQFDAQTQEAEECGITLNRRYVAYTPRGSTNGLYVDAQGCMGGAINRPRGTILKRTGTLQKGLLVAGWCNHLTKTSRRGRCTHAACVIKAGEQLTMPYGSSHSI
jgi:GNAT superfamily N-acetyltransferase